MKMIRSAALAATVVLAGIAAAQQPSADFQRRAAEMKAQYERRAAEMKQKYDERARQLQSQRQATTPQAQPFNAAAAPPPADCWRGYVAAARRATSMEQLLAYLPAAEQRVLKERQAQYDPQEAASGREWHRKQNPKISEESLTYISNPPYVNELAHHQRIAGKFLEVLSVKIDGNKAVISISTTSGGTVNGVNYPYGTAKVEMLGEGSTWKIDRYNDSNVIYLDPPQGKE